MKFFVVLTLIGFLVYCGTTVHLAESHFRLVLSAPKGLTVKGWHYKSKAVMVRAPVAVDAKGCIYIVGDKNGKAYILVVGERGSVERIIAPRDRDGNFLTTISHISVFGLGNHIWTLGRMPGKEIVHRVCVHDHNGNTIMEWSVRNHSAGHWLLDASPEGLSAYVMCEIEATCLRFIIGQKQPQKFRLPTNQQGIPVLGEFSTIFRHGKYWRICSLSELTKQIRTFQRVAEISRADANWFGVVTWAPEEGFRLVTKFKDPAPYLSPKGMSIQWIDDAGNLYCFSYDWSPHPIVNLLCKIKILRNLLITTFNIPIRSDEPNKVLWVFSPRGEVLDKIVLSSLIRPIGGEKLEYGQLVKADGTGIYLEVERVSEPRKYRIVRIVKKPRWKVWWERLKR